MSDTAQSKTVSLLVAEKQHAAEVARLAVMMFPTLGSADDVEQHLMDDTAVSYVATASGARVVVGFVIGRIVGEDAEVLWVGVDPEWRRAGVGSHLLGGFERGAGRLGAARIVFEVAEDNAAALGLYAKVGYERVGARPGYYARPGGAAVDAVILAKAIGQGAGSRTAG